MIQKTVKISTPRINLPKSWKGSKVVVQFPNEDTLLVKRLSVAEETNFEVDETIWNEIEPTAHKVREQVFQEFYPSLYAASKKSSKKSV
mgnify:CR=1 FL=1